MSLSDELRQPSLSQVAKNHEKVIRAAIRLKHAIQADNEIAVVMPKVKVELARQAANGRLQGLSVAEMLALVEGE